MPVHVFTRVCVCACVRVGECVCARAGACACLCVCKCVCARSEWHVRGGRWVGGRESEGYGTTAGHTLESAIAMLPKSVTSVFTKRLPSDGGMIRSSVHPFVVDAMNSSNTHLRRTTRGRTRRSRRTHQARHAPDAFQVERLVPRREQRDDATDAAHAALELAPELLRRHILPAPPHKPSGLRATPDYSHSRATAHLRRGAG